MQSSQDFLMYKLRTLSGIISINCQHFQAINKCGRWEVGGGRRGRSSVGVEQNGPILFNMHFNLKICFLMTCHFSFSFYYWPTFVCPFFVLCSYLFSLLSYLPHSVFLISLQQIRFCGLVFTLSFFMSLLPL